VESSTGLAGLKREGKRRGVDPGGKTQAAACGSAIKNHLGKVLTGVKKDAQVATN